MSNAYAKRLPEFIKVDEEFPVEQDSRVNILVVDDLPEKLLVYEAILKELGQNLITARSGEEALRLMLKEEFAVVLLDVNMPGMDGFETASLIRQRKKCAHTPIIFLTAFTDEMRMAQGYATGAVDYLPTPVVPEILQAKVRVFIELKQMRRIAALQAEEKARRAAAEESVRRSKFIVSASEILMRSKNQKEILHTLGELPIPYLADLSVVCLGDAAGLQEHIEWTWMGEGEQLHSEIDRIPLSVLPELEKAAQQVKATGQFQVLLQRPELISANELAIVPPPPLDLPTLKYAIVLPLAIRGQISGVFVLMRRDAAAPFNASDISLASDLASRVSVVLENAMLLEKIQEADHRKDEFLATLAHELRNPLAPIGNALQLMKVSKEPALHAQAQDTIERQLKHMILLIDDLMDISRITQGKIELRKERILLKDTLDLAVETTQPYIRQRNHTLTIDLPETPIWLEADASRISQIFSNLLNNAAKYTNEGGHIDVSAQLQEDRVVITFRDDGIGIPAHMLPRVFDMFLQVDSSLERAQGGLGIGLTLVKNLVEMHGGHIRVESAGVNQGSAFILDLPVAHAQESGKNRADEASRKDYSRSSLRILVVDDNVESAKTMGWMMEALGHETALAHDARTALEMAHSWSPEVILLDIGLPGMNGYELCRTLRQDPAFRHTLMVAQTGWSQPEHRQRSKDAGFDHHLVKPVDIKALQQILSK